MGYDNNFKYLHLFKKRQNVCLEYFSNGDACVAKNNHPPDNEKQEKKGEAVGADEFKEVLYDRHYSVHGAVPTSNRARVATLYMIDPKHPRAKIYTCSSTGTWNNVHPLRWSRNQILWNTSG